MSKLTDDACQLIEHATDDERRIILAYLRTRVPLHDLETEWKTTAEEILTAIARSNDLTRRGIRGILAEAIFEKRLLPKITADGWAPLGIVGGQRYDFLIKRDGTQVKIQVKLQRKKTGKPMEYPRRARSLLK